MYKLLSSAVILAGSFIAQAQAHVVFGSPEAAPNQFHVADLRIFHGCDASPTTKVTINIPTGVTRVRPRGLAGWAVSVEMTPLENPITINGTKVTQTVSSVTWSGGSIPPFAYEQFEINMMMPDNPGEALSFPVHQTCETGSLTWDQEALDMKTFSELPHPAPFISLTKEPAAKTHH